MPNADLKANVKADLVAYLNRPQIRNPGNYSLDAQEGVTSPYMTYTVGSTPRNAVTFSASNLSQLGGLGGGSLGGNK